MQPLKKKSLKKNKKKKKLNEMNHVTSQKCIGPTTRIGREIQCLPYAGFFLGLLAMVVCANKTNYVH